LDILGPGEGRERQRERDRGRERESERGENSLEVQYVVSLVKYKVIKRSRTEPSGRFAKILWGRVTVRECKKRRRVIHHDRHKHRPHFSQEGRYLASQAAREVE
jgi:hypothetical protein